MKRNTTAEKVDVKAMIEEISNKYSELKIDPVLQELQNENHKLYYSLDIDFLKNVDKKYSNEAKEILKKYNTIDASKLLTNNIENAHHDLSLLKKIEAEIESLKLKIKEDLNTVIDYVDRLSDKIDVSNVTKETLLGILILNKYAAYKIFSAKIDLSDINGTMKQQSKRLIYLKELDSLIKDYNNSNTLFNKNNTEVFINNLYEIIGKYLYLLTDSEFEYTKEAIKKILAYKFSFINKYLPTYSIILTKIWNSKFTLDYKFICNLDLEKNNIYLMTENNVDSYDTTGYICDVPKNFIEYFDMDAMEIINYPLPTIKEKYELSISNFDKSKIYLKAMYTKNNIEFKSILPIIKI